MIGTFTAVAVYIGINILLNVALALRAVHLRQITPEKRGANTLERAVAAHANNADYAGMALASFVFMALLDSPGLLAHFVGAVYTGGRLLIAYAFTWADGDPRLRRYGTTATLFSLVVMAVAIIVLGLELDT